MLLIGFLTSFFIITQARIRPVVLMHGIGASADSMDNVINWIKEDFPGIYIKNCEIGDGFWDSFFIGMNRQVELLAECIRSDPALRLGFNLLGYSQGGLLVRGYVERYNDPPVHNLVTWLGPHGGIYGVPYWNKFCPMNESVCRLVADIVDELEAGRWRDRVLQEHVSFASYWRDPYAESEYLRNNVFLADLNNERDVKNEAYRGRMLSLNYFAMVRSSADDIVIPSVSEWFGFFAPNSTRPVSLQDTPQYRFDWLGLRTLDATGRLGFYEVPCTHQGIVREGCRVFYEKYTRPLLNNTLPPP